MKRDKSDDPHAGEITGCNAISTAHYGAAVQSGHADTWLMVYGEHLQHGVCPCGSAMRATRALRDEIDSAGRS